MIVSQMQIPLASRNWQRVLTNPYQQHALLSACLDGDARFLFRVEPEPRNGMARLLVQSHIAPRWDANQLVAKLPKHLLLSKAFNPTFNQGDVFRFRLKANPTIKRQGKRHPVLGEEQLQQWLRRKIEMGGAKVLGAITIPEGPVRAFRRNTNRRKTMTFSSVRFEGQLQVDTPDRFSQMLESGVGSAKAFGFGLLSLAR